MSIDGARDACIISPTQTQNEAAMSACKLAAEAAAAAVERAKKLESSTAIAAAMAASRVLATCSHTPATTRAPAPALHVPIITAPNFAIACSTAEALKRSSAQHMHTARQQLIDSKLAYLSPGLLSHTHPAALSHPVGIGAPPSTNQRQSASAVPVSFAALTAVITGKRANPGVQTATITSKRVPPGVPTAAAVVKFEKAEMPKNSTGPAAGPASLHMHQRWPEEGEEESDVKKRQRLSGLFRFATDCGTLATNCGIPGTWLAAGSTAASSQQAPKPGSRAYAFPVGSGSTGFNPRAAAHAPHPLGATAPSNTSSSGNGSVGGDLVAGHAASAAATVSLVVEIIESARAATLHHERKRPWGESVRPLKEQLTQLSTLPSSHFETLQTPQLLTLLQLIDSCTKVPDVQVSDSCSSKPLEACECRSVEIYSCGRRRFGEFGGGMLRGSFGESQNVVTSF